MNVKGLLPAARDRLVIVNDDARLSETAARFGTGRADLVVVCDKTTRMVGVISKTDIVSRISECTGHACKVRVDTVMTRDVTYCRPNDALQNVWIDMKIKRRPLLPIIDQESHPLGILHAQDVLQALLSEVEHEEDLLRDYVMGIGYR